MIIKAKALHLNENLLYYNKYNIVKDVFSIDFDWIKKDIEFQQCVCDQNVCDGYIYFIRSGDFNNYKIGYTKNINQRLKSLQTGNNDKLNLVHTIHGNTKIESYLHTVLKNFNVNNEWFQLDDDMIEFIKTIE